MSVRGLRAAGVAVGVVTLLAACTSGSGGPSSGGTRNAVVTSDAPPVGSIEHPRPVECVEGVPDPTGTTAPSTTPPSGTPAHTATRTPTGKPSGAPAAGKDDVTVGPLIWRGLRALASGDQNTSGNRNSDGWHYKIGAELKADVAVTVIIGAQERARAALEYGQGYGNSPAPAVTFHSCPATPTAFPGGFFVAGDGRGCVPVEVRVGDGAPQRVMISFFKGRCPA